MNASEERVIRQVIARLQGEKCTPEVKAALTGPAKLYLDTWVIGSLECLLPESRDLKLAVDLSS